jgi:hypothetical protein
MQSIQVPIRPLIIFLRHPGVYDIEEADELLMATTLHALAEDLALKDIECREQGGDTMALVMVAHGAANYLAFIQLAARIASAARANVATQGGGPIIFELLSSTARNATGQRLLQPIGRRPKSRFSSCSARAQ